MKIAQAICIFFSCPKAVIPIFFYCNFLGSDSLISANLHNPANSHNHSVIQAICIFSVTLRLLFKPVILTFLYWKISFLVWTHSLKIAQ